MQTCRRELPGRTLTWNQRHLLRALRESGQFYNSHRPHQGIANARPLRALAGQGQHRAPSIPDLLIAATAERAQLTVLHLDKDFELIAGITGQAVERLE